METLLTQFYRNFLLVYFLGSLLLSSTILGVGYFQNKSQVQTDLQHYAEMLAISLLPQLDNASVGQLNRQILHYQYHAFLPITAMGVYSGSGEQVASSGVKTLLPLQLSETGERVFSISTEPPYTKVVQPLYRQPEIIEQFGTVQTLEAYLVVVAELNSSTGENWPLALLAWLIYSSVFISLFMVLRRGLLHRSWQLNTILALEANPSNRQKATVEVKLPADLLEVQQRLQGAAGLLQAQEIKNEQQHQQLSELNLALNKAMSEQQASALQLTELGRDMRVWLSNYQLLWQRQEQFALPMFHALLHLHCLYGQYRFADLALEHENIALNAWLAQQLPQFTSLLPNEVSIDWLENAKTSECLVVLDKTQLQMILQAMLLLVLRSDHVTSITVRLSVVTEPESQLNIQLSCDGHGFSAHLEQQLKSTGKQWQWRDIDYVILMLIATRMQAKFNLQSLEGLGLGLSFTLPVAIKPQESLAKMRHLMIFDADAERLSERKEALSSQAFQVTTSQSLNDLTQKLEYLQPDALLLMLPNQAPQPDWLALIRRYQPRLAMQIFAPARCLSQWQPLVACISSSEFCLQQLHDMQLPSQQCLSRKKLLVVDDNETNQAFIGLLLQHTAIDLQTALTGNEVLALCQQQQFDMILLDICLPDISGIEVARLLRQLPDYKSIPILAFTAHALPSEIAEFKLAGMDDILLKPLEPSKFETLLARYRLY